MGPRSSYLNKSAVSGQNAKNVLYYKRQELQVYTKTFRDAVQYSEIQYYCQLLQNVVYNTLWRGLL